MDEEPFQTRSNNGAVSNFNTFDEALNYANETHDKAATADPGTPDKYDNVVWKISFSVSSGERIRLIRDVGKSEWKLAQIEDEVKKVIEEAEKKDN